MMGTLEVSGTALTGTSRGTCYSVVSAGTTENLSDASKQFTLNITFAGNICIRTNTKSSTEILPSSGWESLMSSPDSGHGHEAWTVTPADPTAPVGPLNGNGTIHINGRVTPPAA